MTRFIAICSGKGGTGKTTSAISIASALTFFGIDNILVDANITTPNISLYLGLPQNIPTLHSALNGENTIFESIYKHPAGTKIIPGSLSLKYLNLRIENLRELIGKLYYTTEIVLIDTPAGLNKDIISALNVSNEVLIVTNPELPAITDALKTIKVAESLNKYIIGIVLNKVKYSEIELSKENIESLLDKPVIAEISEDTAIKEALKQKDSVIFTHPNSVSAVNYKKLAAYLIGRTYDEEIKKDTFFKKILHFIKKEV